MRRGTLTLLLVCLVTTALCWWDDEVEPLSDETLAALKSISDKPIKFVINMHYHDDHTGGNAYFHKLAPIIAQENTRKRLQSGGISGNGSSMHTEVKPAPAEALPTLGTGWFARVFPPP